MHDQRQDRDCTCTEGHSHRQPHRVLLLTYEQFHFANAVGEDEGERRTYRLAGAGTAAAGVRPTGFVETVVGALIDLGHDPAWVKTERFGATGGP